MSQPTVFTSYSHLDTTEVGRFLPYFKTLEWKGRARVWKDDTNIEPGNDWRAEIDAALEAAQVAVLFISENFLASDFIRTVELPRLLARHSAGKITLLPVFLSPSHGRAGHSPRPLAGLRFPQPAVVGPDEAPAPGGLQTPGRAPAPTDRHPGGPTTGHAADSARGVPAPPGVKARPGPISA
jgi:hypothetical protein